MVGQRDPCRVCPTHQPYSHKGAITYLEHTLFQLCLLSSERITRLSYESAHSTCPSNDLTLQNTLFLQFVGRAPSLVQHLQLCPISRTIGFKIMTLINDSTLLCRRSRNHVWNSIMSLLMSLTCEVGSSVQSGSSGRLSLGGKVLCGRGV
jgi:hypothetical protein